MPPYSSGVMIPVNPCSASLVHRAASWAVSVSMALRTAAMGLSPAKNLRAVSFRICWLSVSPNCMVVSSRLSTTPLKHRGTEELEAIFFEIPSQRGPRRAPVLRAVGQGARDRYTYDAFAEHTNLDNLLCFAAIGLPRFARDEKLSSVSSFPPCFKVLVLLFRSRRS